VEGEGAKSDQKPERLGYCEQSDANKLGGAADSTGPQSEKAAGFVEGEASRKRDTPLGIHKKV